MIQLKKFTNLIELVTDDEKLKRCGNSAKCCLTLQIYVVFLKFETQNLNNMNTDNKDTEVNDTDKITYM